MSKNLDLIKKYVKIKGRYHKQLRALSYKNDIPIEEVIDIILEDALKDESKFDELFQKRRKKSD